MEADDVFAPISDLNKKNCGLTTIATAIAAVVKVKQSVAAIRYRFFPDKRRISVTSFITVYEPYQRKNKPNVEQILLH